MHKHATITAAMLVMAALCFVILVTGCATKRDIADIQAQLDRMEKQNQATQQWVAHMDSAMVMTNDTDHKLRNDLQSSVADLQQQISKLLASYNDLMQELHRMNRSQVIQKPPTSSPGAQDTGPAYEPSAHCDSLYDEAFSLVPKKQYDKAIAGFKTFEDACPKHVAISDAYYWTGECYWSQNKYQDAATTFEYVLDTFKGYSKAGRAMYKLARCKQELGQKADAKKLFDRVVKEFPKTVEAENAKERLKEIK
jgi:tol-pal system protein YbgF